LKYKEYKVIRDLFCQLLKEKFVDISSFDASKGVMVVWIAFNKKYSWKSVSEVAIN
jgi:GntR family transcriptional regulator/MocR family aminotransferase